MAMLRNALHLGKTLTLRKLWNLLLVRTSLLLSSLLKRPLVWGMPWFVSVETSSVCNLSCPHCATGTGRVSRGNKFMERNRYERLLDEISDTTLMLSLYFQGEPLMHREFPKFVRLASERRIYTQTSTNGQMLTEDVCWGLVRGGLGRIIVSLDGTDAETYRAYRRGGDLGKVEEGIRTLNRIRREAGSGRPMIVVQFLVFRHNQEQLKGIRKYAKALGADRVWIKSAQVEDLSLAEEWIPQEARYSRYEKDRSGNWSLRGKLRNRCSRLWQTAVITSDARIVPCCFDKCALYPMGSAGEQDFADIWKGESYRSFRSMVLTGRKEIDMCTNCSEGVGRIISRSYGSKRS